MSRLLLALCLSLCAFSAMARTAVVADEACDGVAKPGKSKAVGTRESDAASGVAIAAPASPIVTPAVQRHGGGHSALPRWHSLLPGMIR